MIPLKRSFIIMRAVLSRQDLLSLLQKIQNIIPSKPQNPILANILVKAQDNRLTLIASDLILSMEISAQAQVTEPGSVVLSPKRFIPLIRELTAPNVEFVVDDSFVTTIYAGSSRFKLPGMSPIEYPTPPDISQGTRIAFPANILRQMLIHTSFSSGRIETKQIYNSVCIHRNDFETVFTGTDGKRLARSHTKTPFEANWQGSFILPIKTVDEMIRMLDTPEETVDICFLGEKLSLQAGSTLLTSQLIAGQYPDVSKIIPEKRPDTVKVHREELMSLLRQISLFTTIDKPSAAFHFKEGELQLTAANGETGEGVVGMPVNYFSEPLSIAFNPNYLLEILRHSSDETVDLSLTNSYDPGMITDTSDTFFVLMPMRLET
jgi:DNA polymerase-3 subunit beta